MYSRYLYDMLNSYFSKIDNTYIMDYIINDSIHLLSQDPKTKRYIYSVENKSVTVSFIEQKPDIIDIRCSYCDEHYEKLPNKIDDEKIIAVLFYHNFVTNDDHTNENNKFTDTQKEKLNNINFDVDVKITQAIKFRFDNVIYEMINQKNIMDEYLKLYLLCMSNDERAYLFSLYMKNNLKVTYEPLIESIINTSTELTEESFINYFQYIKNINIVKTNNPHLFDFTKQSIAFKMFLMMKGV